MLKELFEKDFYLTFPPRAGKSINLREEVFNGSHGLNDPLACKKCIKECSDKVQLRIETLSDVHCLGLDKVFDLVKEKVGDTCDYMLQDNDRVALVEMTCSQEKYVDESTFTEVCNESKRAKARYQLRNTLSLLYTNGVIKQHLEKMTSRYVVFSWKDTSDAYRNVDSAEKNMFDFISLADEIYSPNKESSFDFGFKWREIRYPQPLEWGKL